MANLPIILLNGTIADANEVMSDFYPLYGPPAGGTGIDETNIDPSNKTGAGDFVLQEYPTFTKGINVNSPAFSSNARLILSAGRLKLVGTDGNDPSPTNPVVFSIQSSTSGLWSTITFTSPANCFIDDSATADSYFRAGSGTPWGTTAGTAWDESMPFFIYVATDGITPVLVMSRHCSANTLPATAGLGYKNNPPATPNFYNFFFMSASNLTVSHAGVNCWLVGLVEMKKTSSDDWTFQTALSADFGLGNFSRLTYAKYFMPVSQNGAASGSNFVTPAGTAPTYTTLSYLRYSVNLNGSYDIVGEFVNVAGGTAGAGANGLSLALPVPIRIGTASLPSGNFELTNGANKILGFCGATLSNPYLVYFQYQTVIATSVAFIVGNDQSNATRAINVQLHIV